MRIIAGLAKGRPIDAVASVTRPTSDRAREALFSTLVSEFGDFAELRILDLYAGTGAIALEALSRGASLVHAVEKDEKAARAITENYEGIKSAHFPGLFHLYSMTVHRFLQIKRRCLTTLFILIHLMKFQISISSRLSFNFEMVDL